MDTSLRFVQALIVVCVPQSRMAWVPADASQPNAHESKKGLRVADDFFYETKGESLQDHPARQVAPGIAGTSHRQRHHRGLRRLKGDGN
ncbi:hypothetical protein [Pseudomonas syringae]|uniref:hypothetical protein n=1 Tax=Pseudomonas syringae TaxID=317 RepID=UPI00117B72A3|nr:hypothetical protein [Pseudomonas syringae]